MNEKPPAVLLCAFVLALLVSGCSRPVDPSTSNSSKADQPLTIVQTESPAVGDAREPELNATHDGRMVLSWVERIADERYALRAAIRNSQGWSQPDTVSEGDNWFVNWADFPSVIAMRDGSLAAHWLVKSGAGTYAYDVNISISRDGGKTWSRPIVPHRDNTQTEHGFVSLVPLPDGRLGAIWLDGRNMSPPKKGEEHASAKESMTLRYAALESNGRLADETQLDDRVCECCQTSAAITSEGVIAVYRDRSEGEIRDIYAVRQSGGTWTAPYMVNADNWEINGCPVNGPSVSAEARLVAVAWFTGVGEAPHVKVAFSDDAGATFSKVIVVDEGEAMGRVDVLQLRDGSALVCWMSGNTDGGAINIRRVRRSGALGPSSVIARTDISRSSGFPRMARLGNEVHFAWTEFGTPSRIRTAFTDLSAFE